MALSLRRLRRTGLLRGERMIEPTHRPRRRPQERRSRAG